MRPVRGFAPQNHDVVRSLVAQGAPAMGAAQVLPEFQANAGGKEDKSVF